MDLDLDGKVAVVTGAAKGIGLAVTKALVEEGAHVVAGSRATGRLAQKFGPRGIRVNSASPGPVGTDLWLGEAQTVAKATGVDADTARQTIITGIGGFDTGRFTTPEEVATLITFLVSGRAREHHRRQLHH